MSFPKQRRKSSFATSIPTPAPSALQEVPANSRNAVRPRKSSILPPGFASGSAASSGRSSAGTMKSNYSGANSRFLPSKISQSKTFTEGLSALAQGSPGKKVDNGADRLVPLLVKERVEREDAPNRISGGVFAGRGKSEEKKRALTNVEDKKDGSLKGSLGRHVHRISESFSLQDFKTFTAGKVKKAGRVSEKVVARTWGFEMEGSERDIMAPRQRNCSLERGKTGGGRPSFLFRLQSDGEEMRAEEKPANVDRDITDSPHLRRPPRSSLERGSSFPDRIKEFFLKGSGSGRTFAQAADTKGKGKQKADVSSEEFWSDPGYGMNPPPVLESIEDITEYTLNNPMCDISIDEERKELLREVYNLSPSPQAYLTGRYIAIQDSLLNHYPGLGPDKLAEELWTILGREVEEVFGRESFTDDFRRWKREVRSEGNKTVYMEMREEMGMKV